jgi:uncharacterized membrane protein
MNIDNDINNPENYKFHIFYFNPKDKRIIVSKQDRYRGWTLNFGNRFTYIIILSIAIGIFIYQLMKS